MSGTAWFAVNVGGVVDGLRAIRAGSARTPVEPAHVLITASLAGLTVFPGGGANGPSNTPSPPSPSTRPWRWPAHRYGSAERVLASSVPACRPKESTPALVAGDALQAIDDGVFAVIPSEWQAALIAQVEHVVSGHLPTPPVPGPA